VIPRGLILAFQFLTRIPMPDISDVEADEMGRSAIWFPLVGLVVGLLLVGAALLGLSANGWMAALLVVLVWVTVTGALHLDGAADLADALGAAHRDSDEEKERFLSVLKDPHIGSFGVVVLISILMSKLVALAWLFEANADTLWALILIPAWTRLGALYWSQSLPALGSGFGQMLSGHDFENSMWIWAATLFLFSWIAVSFLFATLAIAVLLLWREFLKRRVGGMNGDCLGAGIEYCECALLLCVGLI